MAKTKDRRPIPIQLNEADTTKFFDVVFQCTESINEKNCSETLLISIESLKSLVCSLFYPRSQTLHKIIKRILMTYFHMKDSETHIASYVEESEARYLFLLFDLIGRFKQINR